MLRNSLVCNLKPVMYYRFILGFRQNFQSSFGSRFLSKLYPIALMLIIFVHEYFTTKGVHLFHEYLAYGEYFVYILVSFQTKDDFFYSWFKYLHAIDSFPGATKLYRQLDIFTLISMIYSLGFAVSGTVYAYSRNLFSLELKEYFFVCFFFCALDMGRFTICMCLGLLYCRTKVLKMALELNFLDQRLRNAFDVNRFIQMYLALEEKLRNVRRPMNLMAVIGVLCVIIKTIVEISDKLALLKQLGADALDLVDWLALWIPVIYLAVAAVALDLTADNMRDIQAKCVEKRLRCTNERDRCEMQQLLQLLEHCPLSFTVWRFNPLSMYFLLSCFSFCIVNIIAITQIKSFYI